MGYPYQTSVVDVDAIRFGSMAVGYTSVVGTSTATFTNLGIAKDVTFEEQDTFAWIGGDNAELARRLVKQRAVVSGSMVEVDLKALSLLRGSVDTYTSSTGASGPEILISGGLHPQTAITLKLTNKSVRSTTTKYLHIFVWKAYWDGNMTMAFQPDEGEDPLTIPFSFIGVPATTRIEGTKLYRIVDYQTT